MKSFSLPVLAGCVGVSFAIGFAIAWNLQTPENPAHGPAVQGGARPDGAPAGQNQYANPWNKEQTAADTGRAEVRTVQASGLDEQKLREQAMNDPGALRSLIQRYDAEKDQNTKDALKAIIATIPRPEAKAFVTRLATSTDAAQRKEAYELLKQSSPDSPEVRSLLKQALATEQSPTALAQAIAALRPVVVDPAESTAIIDQLRGLTQNADPLVRSQSVLQLGQWDKNGSSQDSMAAALNDKAPEVRQAAIFAIAQSGMRADNLKSALLTMVNNPGESKEVKGSALQVLERFSMNKEEYASFTKARTQFGF